jgi:hypothetical protein
MHNMQDADLLKVYTLLVKLYEYSTGLCFSDGIGSMGVAKHTGNLMRMIDDGEKNGDMAQLDAVNPDWTRELYITIPCFLFCRLYGVVRESISKMTAEFEEKYPETRSRFAGMKAAQAAQAAAAA